MSNDVDLCVILSGFSVKPSSVQKIKEKNIKKSRIVYKIGFCDNFFCLKKTYFDLTQILFIYSLLEWLNIYNFKVPYLLKANDQKPFLNFNNNFYILTNWIDGKKLNYDNIGECIKAITLLSKIHNSTKNILIINNLSPKLNDIKLKDKFKKHMDDIKNFKELSKIHNDNFSNIYLNNVDSILNLCQISLTFSSLINYNSLKTSACHGDFVNKNILIDKTNTVVPIDFDKSSISFSVKDLSYFLRRYLRRTSTNWNINNTITILNYYNLNNELNLDEYLYLISYLTFPQKFWKISKYYFKNIDSINNKEKSIYENMLSKIGSSIDNQLYFSEKLIEHTSNKFSFNIYKKYRD